MFRWVHPTKRPGPQGGARKEHRAAGSRTSLAKLANLLLGAVPSSGITQLQVESNLRVKRSDPFHGANARPKAGAVPVARCWCEMQTLQACQHPSGEPPIGRWSRTGRRGLTR